LRQQAADEAAPQARLGFPQVQGQHVAVNLHDPTDEAARGHNRIAATQVVQHGLVFLLAFLLRPYQQKPEHGDHQYQGNELREHLGRAAGASLGSADGKSKGFKKHGASKGTKIFQLAVVRAVFHIPLRGKMQCFYRRHTHGQSALYKAGVLRLF